MSKGWGLVFVTIRQYPGVAGVWQKVMTCPGFQSVLLVLVHRGEVVWVGCLEEGRWVDRVGH